MAGKEGSPILLSCGGGDIAPRNFVQYCAISLIAGNSITEQYCAISRISENRNIVQNCTIIGRVHWYI